MSEETRDADAYPTEEKALNAAIAKAQGEFPPIPKDKTAQAGSYSYAYADLASILALRPARPGQERTGADPAPREPERRRAVDPHGTAAR